MHVDNAISRPSINNIKASELHSMLLNFGNKPFLRHQAQSFEKFKLAKSYSQEEDSFMKTIKLVLKIYVSTKENVFNSHVLHKIKTDENCSLKNKFLISHRN